MGMAIREWLFVYYGRVAAPRFFSQREYDFLGVCLAHVLTAQVTLCLPAA